MTPQAYEAAGKLILGLAERVSYVKVGHQKSAFGGEMTTLNITNMINGKPITISEVVTEQELISISDPAVIVDSIIEKMRRELKR